MDGRELEAGSRVEVVLGRTEVKIGSDNWGFSVVKDPADIQQRAPMRRPLYFLSPPSYVLLPR